MTFTIRVSGSKYYATPTGGAEFLVASKVTYANTNVGLVNNPAEPTNKYKASEWDDIFGYWAWIVRPTVLAESRTNFEVVNSYDRAQFTFGFGQFAAHVPGGDFIKFFRALLALPEAKDYFPDLTLVQGKINLKKGSVVSPLETATSTQALMDYLNPTLGAVETVEAQNAAKFIHWARTHKEHRQIQVSVMMETAKTLVGRYKTELNGRHDFVCMLVMDIQHQGRAKKPLIQQTLLETDDEKALVALLKIGETTYPQRIETLRTEIKRLRDENVLGKKKYRSSDGAFI